MLGLEQKERIQSQVVMDIYSKFPIAKSLVNYVNDTWTKTDIEVATEKAATRIADFIFE